ncbi:MAG TPA: Clp protease N-terminal domain-containing protein [Ktedonosporobacter sp.]|jgi:excisionase family DNA binding protein|nr:Clp protease N-terminal domain-containing protein [Ktedonosporobacter sp.]
MEHLMTSEEVAEILHVDPVTIRRLVNKGELSAYRIGADYRFSPSDLQSYLQRQRVSAHAESGPEAVPGAQRGQLAQFLGKVLQGKQPTGDRGDRDRFDRFTRRARNVLNLAQEEAQMLQHNYIGTEHLLLGLIREGGGVAAKVLTNLGVELQPVQRGVEAITGRGQRGESGQVGLTPRAKKVIELAVDEARSFDHHFIGTEHLLLGLVREGEGIAAKIIESMGIPLAQVRAEVTKVIGQLKQEEVSASPPVPEEATKLLSEEEQGQSCSRCGACSPKYFRHCFNCGNPFPREESHHGEEA